MYDKLQAPGTRSAERQVWKGSPTMVSESGRRVITLKLSLKIQLFFVCVRIRQRLILDDLADSFKVDSTTLLRYFTSWVDLIYVAFKELLAFPTRRRTDKSMSNSFKVVVPDADHRTELLLGEYQEVVETVCQSTDE